VTRLPALPLLCRALLLAATFFALSANAQEAFTQDDTRKVDTLLRLVQERLQVADEVARTKWNTKAAIEDLPREAQIVERVRGRAAEFGLEPQLAGDFFQAQIDASKVIQRALHERWATEKRPPFDKVADLGKDIRPQLDRLEPALLSALHNAKPVLDRPGATVLLDVRTQAGAFAGSSSAAVDTALKPLYAVAR
jgi:chorismate mutase